MLTLATSNIRHLGDQTWPSELKSASDWFLQMFPTQARVFGSPFLEQNQPGHGNSNPLSPNLDFLAGCLGGDERLGHRVIYYAAELQFYYFDPRDHMYHATTDQKLGNLLRGLLARCASEIKGEGHLFNVFHTFRSDALVKAVVSRAKSVLEAAPEFFGVKSQHQRVAGPEIHERLAQVFAQQLLESHPGSILTVGQSFTLFNHFAKTKNMPPIKRSDFKSMMAEVIRDAYGLGVRNDLMNAETQKQQCGWLGLRPAARA